MKRPDFEDWEAYEDDYDPTAPEDIKETVKHYEEIAKAQEE